MLLGCALRDDQLMKVAEKSKVLDIDEHFLFFFLGDCHIHPKIFAITKF